MNSSIQKCDTLPQFIDTPNGLVQLCDRLAGCPRVGIDTEFIAERNYYPLLGIIQIATDDLAVVVDSIAIEDLSPLRDVLADPRTVKIFHAGKQDLMIFFNRFKILPTPFFDTQIAAAFIGYGDQVSYAKLVERVAKVKLSKHSGLTDWSHRPLTARQMTYALEDVRHLPMIYEHLVQKLESMGRLSWCREEMDLLVAEEGYERPEPEELFRSVKGWATLDEKGLAVLRELAVWRENAAKARNKPRNRIVSDSLLVELARLAPSDTHILAGFRPLHPRERSKSGEQIVNAVLRALEMSPDEWPTLNNNHSNRKPEIPGLIELLTAYLRSRSEELQIAARFVATREDLEFLIRNHGKKRLTSKILRGWRKKLIGDDLQALVEGRSTIGVDASSGKLKLVAREAAK